MDVMRIWATCRWSGKWVGSCWSWRRGLYGQDYHLYFDRFYTSPHLLHWLRLVDLSGCGTVMTNRIGFPKDLKVTGKGMQGESEWMQCANTGILATRWCDKKPIFFLSIIVYIYHITIWQMNGPLFLAEEWHCSELLTLRIIVNYGGHFVFSVAMTTEENVEHMIVLLLYEIHVIRTVQISNISDSNMLEMKIYSGHFDEFDTMVTGQKTSYKVLFCDHCIYVHISYNYLTNEWTSISCWRMTLQWVAYITNNCKLWRPFCFFVAMTTEENVEHMIVLLLYEIHVIRTVQISNISDNNMLEMKMYSGHFDVFATMVTGQKTSYKVLFCDHCIYVYISYNYLTNEWTSISCWRMTQQWVAYITNNCKLWRPFCFFVAMTTEENVEHMIVLLLYEIHAILTVHISTFLMITC